MVRSLRGFRLPAAALAVAAALGPAAGPGFAQEKTPAPSVVQESAGVTLIEIPVNVIGKDGKPVSGLTLQDFELTDDGKKQAISGMDFIDLSRTAPVAGEAAAAVPAAARRLWLLVFDLSYTSPSGLMRARDGARRFVTESMKPNDLAAVGTLSVDTGWKLLVNFTRDRRQLAWAVDSLGLTANSGRTIDPLSFAYQPPGPTGPGGVQNPSGGKGLSLEDLRDIQRMQKQANDDLARARVTKLVSSLGGIGHVLDATRGRKHVLFFSEGFETRLLSGHMAGGDSSNSLQQPIASAALDTATPQGAGDAAASGELWKIDSDTRYGNTATRERMTEALSQFNRSDAVLDAIDISGLRADSDVSGGAKAGSGTDALFAMASATDGDLVRNANQLGGELGKLEERTALVYLLVYQPKGLSKPGAFHVLKVKVKTSGARVLARSGYYEPRPYRSLSPLEKVLAAGDLVTGGSRENEISANLLVAPFASQTDAAQVPVLLEIPGGPLLAGDAGDPTVGVQIYVYANDESGTLVDYVASEMTLDLAKVRSGLEAGGLKFYGTLYLPAGKYGIRALVRNATTGRSGVYSTTFPVPEMPGGAPTVLPPFFQEAPGQWLMVRGNPRADAPPRPADYPFAVAGDSFIPSALPALKDGAAVPVAVVAYNFGAAAKPEPLEVQGQVVGADGVSRPADMTVTRRSDIERGGGRKVVLDFKPQGLPPGRYALKVSVTDPASKKTAESAGPFEVK